ncbi:hypothetical protein EON65_04065 [archaeon]|nr:MAG: hypothetical protein EON65_04065 [archaeon]
MFIISHNLTTCCWSSGLYCLPSVYCLRIAHIMPPGSTFIWLVCLLATHVSANAHPNNNVPAKQIEQCCSNPFIFLKRYEKGFFNQINSYLYLSLIGIHSKLTHITPFFTSNYLLPSLQRRSKPCLDVYSTQSIRDRDNANCSLDVPFESVLNVPVLQKGLGTWRVEGATLKETLWDGVGGKAVGEGAMIIQPHQPPLPTHCLLSISQAEKYCNLSNLVSLPSSAFYNSNESFFNATTFTSTEQSLALRDWVMNMPQHLLYLDGNFTRNITMKLSHNAFQTYRRMRWREIAFFQPGPLLHSYVQEALAHPLLRGGFHALHLRIEKDMMGSKMVRNYSSKTNMKHIISYLLACLPPTSLDGKGGERGGKEGWKDAILPLYIAYAGELPISYRQALEDAGYKVVTKSDLWPRAGIREKGDGEGTGHDKNSGVLSIQSREILGFFEFHMFQHATVFVGMSRSSLSLYAFERRAIMAHRYLHTHTHSHPYPSLDFLSTPEECCMGGVGYEQTLTLNAGHIILDRRYRLVFVTEDVTGDVERVGTFLPVLQRALRRLGHYTYTLPYNSSSLPTTEPTLLGGEGSVDMFVVVWKPALRAAILPSFIHQSSSKVIFYIDHREDMGEQIGGRNVLSLILSQPCHALVFPTHWAHSTWLASWDSKKSPLPPQFVIWKGVEPTYYYPIPNPLTHVTHPAALSGYGTSPLTQPYRLCSVATPLGGGLDEIRISMIATAMGNLSDSFAWKLAVLNDRNQSHIAPDSSVDKVYIRNDAQLGAFWRGCDVCVVWVEGVILDEHVLSALATFIPVVVPNTGPYQELIGQGGVVYTGSRSEVTGLVEGIRKVVKRYDSFKEKIPIYNANVIAEEFIQLLQM